MMKKISILFALIIVGIIVGIGISSCKKQEKELSSNSAVKESQTVDKDPFVLYTFHDDFRTKIVYQGTEDSRYFHSYAGSTNFFQGKPFIMEGEDQIEKIHFECNKKNGDLSISTRGASLNFKLSLEEPNSLILSSTHQGAYVKEASLHNIDPKELKSFIALCTAEGGFDLNPEDLNLRAISWIKLFQAAYKLGALLLAGEILGGGSGGGNPGDEPCNVSELHAAGRDCGGSYTISIKNCTVTCN